jgi:hypothetical protein
MTVTQSTALPFAWFGLRLLIVLNALWGACILALLGATIYVQDWTFRALGIDAASGIPQVILGLQAVAALGLAAIPLNHLVLSRLLRIVETVRRGDPFVADNAYRLHAIAWILLALELLSIVIGAIGKAISSPRLPIHLDAGFSWGGWLAVLLTFVLARVFAEGALMRRDLEGTV